MQGAPQPAKQAVLTNLQVASHVGRNAGRDDCDNFPRRLLPSEGVRPHNSANRVYVIRRQRDKGLILRAIHVIFYLKLSKYFQRQFFFTCTSYVSIDF